MNRRGLAALLLAGGLVIALTGCGGGGAGSSAGGGSAPENCQNEILKPDAPVVTYWSWLAEAADVVDHFNETHDDVQVCWTNAGAGADEYAKLSTALEAGSGAPDVVQIEYDWLNSYVAQGALVDLTKHGADNYKERFLPGAWNDASSGGAVYGIPLDTGPMGLYYREDVFLEAGIEVPATWDEYAAAAQKLKDQGGDVLIGNFPVGGNGGGAGLYALVSQTGAQPFNYDASAPTELGINVNDEGSKKVLNFWLDLVDRGLVGKDQAFSPELTASLSAGKYATMFGAVWYSGHITAAAPDQAGEWRAAPLPQWDLENPVATNWGGSTFAVTVQANDPDLATKVAAEMYGDETSQKLAAEKGALFPVAKAMQESTYLADLSFPYYGDQQIMKDVFLPASADYEGVNYGPFSKFYYDEMSRFVSAAANGDETPDSALDALQESLEDFATAQGFTVE